MCLSAIAIGVDARFPFVVAANRDEFHARPAEPLGWWTPDDRAAPVLAGRDLEGGGTWFGLSGAGRFALLTNVRDPGRHDATAPTRGRIVTDWLTTDEPTDRFWARTALSGHNGFNLVAADFVRGECFWASNVAPHPQRLGVGVYGVSNALLDTPWPKLVALKTATRDALSGAESSEELAARLFDALRDRRAAADNALPATGVPLALERRLSPAFIHMPDRGYGTRSATLLIIEAVGERCAARVFERSFDARGEPVDTRMVPLADWPPSAIAQDRRTLEPPAAAGAFAAPPFALPGTANG